MKLRSLTVNQFKKFTSPVRLSGLADGLNLVIGPNEMGKSTLLEALRAVLFERHRSRAQPIMALRNDRTQAAPVVEAEFEVEGEWYRLRKRFLKSPFARLECGDGRVMEGDAAEEELRRLLGFQEAGTRGATEDTLGMWGVLWVRQGQSFGAPSLPDSARASLSEGLEAEVGSVLGGRRGRELPQVVEDRLEELVTRAQRRPRGAYKEAIDGVAALEEELAGLQAQRTEMSETLERLSSAQDELARLTAGEAAGEDEASLRAARAELQRQEQLEARITAARSQLELRQRDLEAAERRLSERAALRERIADQERELAREEAELEALLPEEVSQRDGLAAAQEQARRAEAGWSAAEASSRRARTLVNAVASGAELERLRAAREAASAAAAALGEARRQAAAILVDDAALARIREAERRSTRAAAQLEAQATRVRFALSPQSSGQGQLLDDGLLVDGEPLSEAVRAGAPLQVVDPLVIEAPPGVRITVEPVIADRDRLVGERASAATELEAALSAAGAASLAEAETLYGRRAEWEREASQAERELARAAPSDGLEGLGERIASLEEQLRVYRRELELAAGTELPARADAEEGEREAEERRRAAEREREASRAALHEREAASRAQSERVGELRRGTAHRRALAERQQAELEAASAEADDVALAQELEAAREAVRLEGVAAAALERDWSEAERDRLEARIGRLERVLEERSERRTSVEVELAGLRERLQLAEGVGIVERAGDVERRLELGRERLSRLEREAAVLELLLSTLRDAEREAKERYLAPVLDRVSPYLRMLFPNADLSMDEDLSVTGMLREGGREERFEHLSLGTQEQVAVLIRLAFAELLVERGVPAAVILDDALAFSDDQRMGRMFDILSHAGGGVQIVVFTCREQLFEGLGARRLRLSAVDGADAEDLRSA